VSGLAITSKSVVVNTPLPNGEDPLGGTESLLGASQGAAEAADRFLADSRGEEAVASARRGRWARQLIEESTTISATLHASVGNEVFLILRTGERRRVEVSSLGEDYVQVRDSASIVWIRLSAVIAVEAASSLVANPEGFDPAEGLLSDVLEDLVADELQIRLCLAGGAALTGLAISVGAALRLRLPQTGHIAVVDLFSIEMILLKIPQSPS
jgi:hypothetical protein